MNHNFLWNRNSSLFKNILNIFSWNINRDIDSIWKFNLKDISIYIKYHITFFFFSFRLLHKVVFTFYCDQHLGKMIKYRASQKVCSGFSIPSYGKTQMHLHFLANPKQNGQDLYKIYTRQIITLSLISYLLACSPWLLSKYINHISI